MTAPIQPWFTLFEIQGPEQKVYASPYIEGKNDAIKEATQKIFTFLNEHHIVFVVKEGPSLTALTTNSVLSYTDFFKAYKSA